MGPVAIVEAEEAALKDASKPRPRKTSPPDHNEDSFALRGQILDDIAAAQRLHLRSARTCGYDQACGINLAPRFHLIEGQLPHRSLGAGPIRHLM
jgi:hypothetical protein